jgi:hypothetical protein
MNRAAALLHAVTAVGTNVSTIAAHGPFRR